MLVTGAPGTGKTTLCRDLLEKLDPEKYRVALIFNPFFSGVEMLQALHSEFGLGDAGTTSRKELLDRLNAYLIEQLHRHLRRSTASFD
jgi:type II secretory pathway predicted ATPase ExeA